MGNKNKKYTAIFCGIVVVLIFIDQILKFWIKTHMSLGSTIPLLGNWFNLHFVENEGMAFGISFGQQIGKLSLSILRLILVGLLVWYFFRRLRDDKIDGIVLTIFCLVVAGALGNIIDSLFYGLCFTESSYFNIAQWSPGNGYAPFFFGKVVDMFYLRLFPIPDKFPIWGGSYFFPAVFNFADSCITIGIFLALIFNKKIFNDIENTEISNETINNQKQ